MSSKLPQLKYRDLASILLSGGATYVRRGGRTSHHIWSLLVDGCHNDQVIPAHDDGSEVLPGYIRRLRRAWRLLPEDGVSDHDFLAGKWGRK